MQQLYSIKTLSLFVFVFILIAMLNNSYISSNVIKYLNYVLEIFFILFIANKIDFIGTLKSVQILFILIFFLTINFIVSPYANFTLLLKIYGYIFVFLYAKNFNKTSVLIYNKWIIRFLIFVPLLSVLFLDNTPTKKMFFPNSNTFTYWGGCVALFYYVISSHNKKRFMYSLLILLAYIAVGTSLGIFVALAFSVIILNRKNIKLIVITFVFFLLIIYLTLNSDMEIFLRLKNQILVFTSLSLDDWMHLQDLNLYYVQEGVSLSDSERSDNTSALWRFQHWVQILNDYFKYWYYSIIFGLGDGYSSARCGSVPHNDYLRVFAEYGCIVFAVILSMIRRLLKVVQDRNILYIIYSILIYHFTENLVDSFPANCLLYFSFGYLYYHGNQNIKNYQSLNNKVTC